MSRSSPGRYALHEFAKNVFDVRVTDAAGKPLAVARARIRISGTLPGTTARVRVVYRVFGDRIDGTYLADRQHARAHQHAGGADVGARLESRPVTLRFEPPPGQAGASARSCCRARDPFTFTAPNLQYLMDSPTELSAFALRTFTVPTLPRSPVFRLVVHHTGTDAELDAFAADVEKIVREARDVFGEFPAYEGDTYTFLADYLPWADGDGMEHRNSTILTSATVDPANRARTARHRRRTSSSTAGTWSASVRGRSSRSTSKTRTCRASCGSAEGFTSYYGPLVMLRAGLTQLDDFAAEMAERRSTR